MRGMLWSVITASTWCFVASSRASSPSLASITSYPASRSTCPTICRIEVESSTARMVLVILDLSEEFGVARRGCGGGRRWHGFIELARDRERHADVVDAARGAAEQLVGEVLELQGEHAGPEGARAELLHQPLDRLAQDRAHLRDLAAGRLEGEVDPEGELLRHGLHEGQRRHAAARARLHAAAFSTTASSPLVMRRAMSTRISIRSPSGARPLMKRASRTLPNSGAGRISSRASAITSETASTRIPITRPAMLRMITTSPARAPAAMASFTRRSTIGTIVPRRLITPFRNAGALAMRVTDSWARISCTLRMSIAYSSSPRRNDRNSSRATCE